MPFSVTPLVQVERTKTGAVRSLEHLMQPYGLPSGVLNSEKLGEAYLKDVAAIYGMNNQWLGALSVQPSNAVENAGTEVRFAQQNTATGTATVSFQQTHFGVPVWETGFTVNILMGPLRVVGSLSSMVPKIEVTKPSADARCMGDRLTTEGLRQALGVKQEIVINTRKLWIYRYNAAQRLPSAPRAQGTVVEGGKGLAPSDIPTLPLPPVEKGIEDGHYYVVTEVLFELPQPPHAHLTWRAFVEVDTCSVLYLRALVQSCTGNVYLKDPLTATGNASTTACSPASTLDPLQTSVTLQGLVGATPQGLTGAYASSAGTTANPSPTTTSSPCDFTYSTVTANFAAVCAYYHLDELFRLIISFGYNPISNYFQNTTLPVPINFLNLPGVVNSFTYPNSTGNGFGSISSGIEESGCPVGIATDYRVTMHEFVHGMLDDRTHNGLLGFSHNGGDAFGAIYMDPGSLAPDRFLPFPWVPLLSTASNPGSLRRIDRTVAAGWAWGGTQDDGADTANPIGQYYGAEQILSTTLFNIYRSTGGDSVYLYEQQLASRFIMVNMTNGMAALPIASSTPLSPTSYASALINADVGLTTPFTMNLPIGPVSIPGGTIGKVIRWAFEQQGSYQPPGAPTPVTTAGAPPDVDVYITNGNNGEYPYLEDFWENTNVWNLLTPDPSTTPADHQTPVINVTNYAYCTVSNRGTQAASNVVVSGYTCAPSAGLLWPDDWQAMTTASITVPGTIAPGATVTVGPFSWTPTVLGHECMLMVVSATGDLSNADPASTLPCAAGPTPHWRLVPFDNNMGQRNVAPVAGGGGLTGLVGSFSPRRFWAKNPYDYPVHVTIEGDTPDFLTKLGWGVEFGNPGGASFSLPGRGSREIVLRLKPGSDFTPTDVRNAGNDATIVFRVLVNQVPVGGMSYWLDPDLKTPPREFPGKGGEKDCEAEKVKGLLECLSIPIDDVKSVRIKRITLDIDFKEDCC